MAREAYAWFQQTARRLNPHCIMGNDYYVTNERLVSRDGRVTAAGKIFGFYVISRQYFDRYHMPMMHTETNLPDAARSPTVIERMGECYPLKTGRRANRWLHLVQSYRSGGLGLHPPRK